MDNKTLPIILAVCVSIFLSSLACFLIGVNLAQNTTIKESVVIEQPKLKVLSTPINTNVIADVAERSMPWVVNIKLKGYVSPRISVFDFFGFSHYKARPRHKIKIGGGSGFIISKDGYILTNGHVVKKTSDIEVNLYNNKTYKARVIGIDEVTDLAVLKIEEETQDLPVANIGDSSALRIGEWVIAVGSPLGFEQTVTQGIISAKNRRVQDLQTSVDFIQTDAAINPGNSGGPLINLKGEVIGINTAIRADAQNIGFAIPINTAKNIYTQIIKNGKVSRPWIGIEMREVRTKDGSAVRVERVWPGSPGSKAGLRRKDIITKVDGKKVDDGKDIQIAVRKHAIGESIKFDILRNGRRIQLDIVTEKLPDFSSRPRS